MSKRLASVYTLLVTVGRSPDDDLPDGATGAALLCFASGISEEEAVRESVAVLKQAGMAPLDVSGYGTLADRMASGHEISGEERSLMDQVREQNAVVVAEIEVLYDGDQADA